MKTKLYGVLLSALLCASQQLLAEDITNGSILVLDRKAGVMVLSDKTVWSLESMKSPLSANIKAGDQVEVRYESDEEGVSDINSIMILPPETDKTGIADISEGTVLAYDRKANLVILTDRTVWALELSKSPAPTGLMSGDRVRIQYESDEEGISSIYSIEILPN